MAAIRPILSLPDPRLRRSARTVRVPDRGIDRLADELLATMRAADGMGLAAPQVGEDLRLAVVEVGDVTLVLVNPGVVARRGRGLDWEGCLSVPHLVAAVERPAQVTVAAVDLAGHGLRRRADGLLARAIVHEVDHLAGRLYVDLVDPEDLIDVRQHPVPPGPLSGGPAPARGRDQ
jgi:peptide deformylase